MIFALILFAVTYVLMLVFGKYRPYIALASGLIFVVSGMLPLGKILGAIDFNVLLMIAGTMGIVALFIESRMPELLADLIMARVSSVRMSAVAMALFAGIISAFVDNVATVLIIYIFCSSSSMLNPCSERGVGFLAFQLCHLSNLFIFYLIFSILQ